MKGGTWYVIWLTYTCVDWFTNAISNDQDSAAASVYQYNSLLGSGFFISFLVLFVQFSVPVLILIYAARQTSRFPAFLASTSIINSLGLNNGPAPDKYLPATNASMDTWDLEGTFATNWTIFCDIGQP